jgi:hypothetical protein
MSKEKKKKKTARKTYERILEIQQAAHKKNQNRIKWGIRCVVLIPIIFLILMFTMESSKYVFLVLWVASLFVISAYLIYVEYADYKVQETMVELGFKDEDGFEGLVPENLVEARLEELGDLLEQSSQRLQKEKKSKKKDKKKDKKKSKNKKKGED